MTSVNLLCGMLVRNLVRVDYLVDFSYFLLPFRLAVHFLIEEAPRMFWLKLVTNFIKILREGQTPAQVAGGFALGSILGLSPMLTLQGLLVWLIILVLDVNLSAATFSLGLFALIAYIFDPIFHRLGYFLLAD